MRSTYAHSEGVNGSLVSNDDIRDLLKIFIDSGVDEMEVKRGENSLRLRRGAGHVPAADFIVSPQIQPPPATAPSAPAVLQSTTEPSSTDVIVKSPIVGTFYESPKPGDAPFVKVGDTVSPGQVLCIIESMKLMNEIESEVAGTIVAKLLDNGRPVEYGEALFTIRPR